MGRLVLHAGNHLPPTSMLITLLLRHGGKVISDTPSVQLFSHSHTTAKSVGITQEQLDYTQSVFKKMFNGASRVCPIKTQAPAYQQHRGMQQRHRGG